jgi:ABC-2 type transport system permease protein
MASAFGGTTADVLTYLDMRTHYENIIRGVFDSKDFIYFLSIIFMGLVASEVSLLKRQVN